MFLISLLVVFFFFQAEDGIRDATVTGVQTCALPILRRRASDLAIQFRLAHGTKQPATLHEDELEYQEGWKERRARLERQFEVKPPLTFGRNGHGANDGRGGKPASARTGKRPGEID